VKSGWKSLAKTTLVPVAAGILAVMLTLLPYADVLQPARLDGRPRRRRFPLL